MLRFVEDESEEAAGGGEGLGLGGRRVVGSGRIGEGKTRTYEQPPTCAGPGQGPGFVGGGKVGKGGWEEMGEKMRYL